MASPDSALADALRDRYRIERPLGAGGMATVYLAQDLRHDRPVALKVLRPELAAALGAERFLAEIRTTANLQHPHILGLIDSGESAGQLFYVMPLVKGESLRARLDREKQLPVEDAVRIAHDVALALDYAHREGVIHRDIKPENILLQDGQAMVADFGIALAVTHAGAERLTATGLSVGTPQYMSPEQAMGERQLTARSDVYSLGCVLYEMLAGEPPFNGPTVQAIVARAMISEPHPITTMRSAVPAHVGAAVHTALRKVAADRFTTAQAFADALVNTPATTHPGSTQQSGRAQWKIAALVALLVAAGVTAGWTARRVISPSDGASRSSHLSYVLPTGAQLASLLGLALSPDGTTIVFADGEAGAPTRLMAKRLDSLDAFVLVNTDGAAWPFFSPDGASIGFFAGSGLRSVSLRDGSVVSIADSVFADRDATWGADGYIVFGANSDKPSVGIRRVPAKGGPVEVVSRLDSANGDLAHYAPQVLPGTRTVIFIVATAKGRETTYRLVSQSLAGGPVRTVLENVRHARYLNVDGGRLMYQVGRDVFVCAFDVRTAVASSTRTRVFEGVSENAPNWTAAGDVVVYRPVSAGLRSIEWVSREGTRTPLRARPGRYRYPALSPDDNRIAMIVANDAGSQDAWIYDINRDIATRASTDGGTSFPIWTPDGTRLTAYRQNGSALDLQYIAANGTTVQDLLFHNGDQLYPASWSRDGHTLVVMRLGGPAGTGGLWALDVGNDKSFRQLLPSASEFGGRLSPDNKWLAFFGRVDKRFELFVTSFPNPGPRWQVSRDGAREAVWSRNGNELFFRNGKQMLAAAVHAGATFSTDAPRVLFEDDFVEGGGGPGNVFYDVSRDGKFLMLREPSHGPLRLNIVQGWQRLARESEAHNR